MWSVVSPGLGILSLRTVNPRVGLHLPHREKRRWLLHQEATRRRRLENEDHSFLEQSLGEFGSLIVSTYLFNTTLILKPPHSFSKDLSTDQESPGEKPARRRRIRRTKPTPRVEEGSRTSDENAVAKPADSLFSETTKRYLKSTGLHSKRIERLLMKYLGPSQEIVEQECVTPCPSPRSFGEIEACATANNA